MKTRKILLLIFLLSSLAQFVQAQSKSYIVPLGVFYLDASSSPYNQLKGGDTLYFQAGSRDYLCLKNFKGAPGNPIVITNLGGSVVINTTHYYGISIQNCRYIKLTGAGCAGIQYGFDIQRVTNGSGVGAGYLSSDYEIDHVSIQNTLLGALYAKTDPDCTTPSTREKFTQYNTIIHDNYVANCGDEGMYIGSTKYDGQTVSYNGKDTLLLPSLLDGVQVYNNIVKYAGWDGIQVSSASKNCKIYNNTILFDSQSGTYSQMSGIMIGGGTKCDCYNNYIADGKGDGIDVMGLGGTRIFNNIIVNAGLTYFPGDFTYPKHGMFISDNSVQQDSTFYIFNNDIINPKMEGIRFSTSTSKNNLISSNIIINPGGYDYYQNGNTSFKGIDSYVMIQKAGTSVTLKNNYYDRTGSLAGFSSPAMHEINDLKPTSGSPLIDAADTNPKASATFDFLGNPRPSGLNSDIGALEYSGAVKVFTGGTIASNQTINAGAVPAALTNSTSPSGYSGTLEFKWQQSTVSATSGFIDLAGSNADSYAPGILNAATWYRRLVRVTTVPDWTAAVCSNVVCISINALLALPAANAGTNKSICLNSSTQIGSTAVSGSTYSWTSSPSGFTSTVSNPVVTPLVTTTYTLVETVTATGASNTNSVIVTVNPRPAVPAPIGGTTTLCVGGTTTLTESTTGGSWSSASSAIATISSSGVVAGIATGSAIIYYTVTNSYNCSNSVNTTATVNAVAPAVLPAANAGANRSICQNSSTQIGAASVTGNTYSWTSSPAGFTSTVSNPVVTPPVTTTYTLVETVTATGATNTNSVIVTVNPRPAVPAPIGGTTTLCVGGTTTLTESTTGGSWSSASSAIATISGSGVVTGIATGSAIIYYTVTNSSNCSNSVYTTVTVTALTQPVLPAANAGANRTICQNSSTQIGAAPVTGNMYSWTSSPAGFTSTVSNPAVAPSVTTTYTLVETVTATGASKSNSVVVTVNALPAISAITGNNVVCAGSTIQLSDNTLGGVWSSSSTTIATVGSTGAVKGVSAGVTSINYRVTNASGCSAGVSALVTVNGPPAIPGNFTVYSTQVKLGQSNIPYTVPYVAGVSYVWNWSGKGVTIKGTSNSVLVSFSYNATSGTLSVKAVNSCGASPERSIIVLSYKGAVLPGELVADSTSTVQSNLNENISVFGAKNELAVYPNPTKGAATFEFLISEDAKVSLDIFSMTGQRVAAILDANVEAGSRHSIPFNQALAPGVYPCILRWKGQSMSTKLMVTR